MREVGKRGKEEGRTERDRNSWWFDVNEGNSSKTMNEGHRILREERKIMDSGEEVHLSTHHNSLCTSTSWTGHTHTPLTLTHTRG